MISAQDLISTRKYKFIILQCIPLKWEVYLFISMLNIYIVKINLALKFIKFVHHDLCVWNTFVFLF